jgi:hypothetical protein
MRITDEQFRQALGRQLGFELAERNRTPQDLASAARVRGLGDYLAGKGDMPLSELRRVADAFGVDASTLLGAVEARAAAALQDPRRGR